MQENDPIKIALIGIGHVAEYQLEATNTLPQVTLIAANDINSAKATVLPEEVEFIPDLDKLLAIPDIDLFLVSTPNITHYNLGRKVLEAGRSLLLEKPCCEYGEQMDELIGLSQAKGSNFSVALHAAYGQDVLWFMDYINQHSTELGPLTGFHCGFFDPYYADSNLAEGAESLGGSWFDSGINALSVVGRFVDPEQISTVEGRMTVIPSIPCSEVQGSASFEFKSNLGQVGNGIVETNWCLGINRKITRLFYALTNTRVTLDHSNEQAVIERAGKVLQQENFRNQYPRLTNHYINLFTDIVKQIQNGTNNLAYAQSIHQLFFQARTNKR